jgi:hypothetical protein
MISPKHPVSLNQAVNTVLAQTEGPVALKNWYNTTIDPTYTVNISGTGAAKLQGTNTITDRLGSFDEYDMLPTDGASWSDIATFSSGSTTNTFSTSYKFIRLIISTQGTGTITGWVIWN